MVADGSLGRDLGTMGRGATGVVLALGVVADCGVLSVGLGLGAGDTLAGT